MLSGTKELFAIEAEPLAFEGHWIWGRFRFWLCNQEVGDWARDDTVVLDGCVGWLREFERESTDRVVPSLAHRSPQEIFRLIVDPAFSLRGAASIDEAPPFADAYSRFHIAHVGMSSFDRYYMVLVKAADGAERCLWQKVEEEEIHDCWLPPGEMERVARQFCDEFEVRYIKQ